MLHSLQCHEAYIQPLQVQAREEVNVQLVRCFSSTSRSGRGHVVAAISAKTANRGVGCNLGSRSKTCNFSQTSDAWCFVQVVVFPVQRFRGISVHKNELVEHFSDGCSAGIIIYPAIGTQELRASTWRNMRRVFFETG